MTFLVAFARPDFAVLASDTRTRFHQTAYGDCTGFSDDDVKLKPCGNGWLASGPSLAWRDVVLTAHAARDNNAYMRAMRELEEQQPEDARFIAERQQTIRIGANDAGCFRQYFNWMGLELGGGDATVPVPLYPVGSKPAALQQRFTAYQHAVRAASLPAILTATAGLYRDVYAHCGPEGSMSPLLSVGIVWADGRRTLVGPLPHDTITAASDECLAALLTAEVTT